MATKAKPEDVIRLGFSYQMFLPMVEEDGGFLLFVQDILDDNVNEIKTLIGSTAYDDATKVSDVKRIEVYLAAAELWERKGNLVLRDRVVSGGTSALLNMTESVKSDEYRDRARAIVDRLNGQSGIALSSEESSHFPQDS